MAIKQATELNMPVLIPPVSIQIGKLYMVSTSTSLSPFFGISFLTCFKAQQQAVKFSFGQILRSLNGKNFLQISGLSDFAAIFYKYFWMDFKLSSFSETLYFNPDIQFSKNQLSFFNSLKQQTKPHTPINVIEIKLTIKQVLNPLLWLRGGKSTKFTFLNNIYQRVCSFTFHLNHIFQLQTFLPLKKLIIFNQYIFFQIQKKLSMQIDQGSFPIDGPPTDTENKKKKYFIFLGSIILLVGVGSFLAGQYLLQKIQSSNQKIRALQNKARIQSKIKKYHNISEFQYPIRDLAQPLDKDYTSFYCEKTKVSNILPKNGQRQYLANTSYGFPIFIDTGGIQEGPFNSVAYSIVKFGVWDPTNLFAMGKLIRPGFKILNVGAQFGLQCLALARIAGPTGKAVMFEPYSYSYNNLVKSIQINNLTSTAQVHKLAVSDKPGKGQINVYKHNTGMSQINNPSFGGQQKQEIQIVVLDDYLPKNTTFDFVLIDAQRYEIQVILSMKQIIKRSPYLVMLIEWSWNQKTPESKDVAKARSLIQFLKDQSYRIYHLKDFDSKTCRMGEAALMRDWQNLFTMPFSDLLLVPSSILLPY